MYDDSWYSILPDPQPRRDDTAPSNNKHRRRESLLKQSNDGPQLVPSQGESLEGLLEEPSLLRGPPEATLIQRANSYSNFHQLARSDVTKDANDARLRSDQELSIMNNRWDPPVIDDWYESGFEDDLLDASQEEFILYRDQLRLTERHLDTLIEDTTSALNLLAGLSESFDTVERETTAFQSQCQVLLDDQKRLKRLKDEVGDDLQYYSYLEPITRRLNAPGASRLVRDESFVEMLTNLNNCIWFMSQHPEHRESETYLARYTSLLLRALNLFESQFSKDLSERLEDIRKRRTEGSLNDTTLHALLYRTMSKEMNHNLNFIGRWAAIPYAAIPADEPEEPSYPYEHLRRTSEAAALAAAQLSNLIRVITNWRRDLLSPIVQEFILTLNTAIEQREDAFKACRTCIKTVLDLLKEELKYIHGYFFASFWAMYKEMDTTDDYTAYMRDLCKQVADEVYQVVGRVGLLDAVELTNWIERCYVPDFSQYTSGQEDTDTRIFESHRRNITLRISCDIKEIILARFSEMTLRKIEKYEPSQQDLEIAPPYVDRRESLSGSKVPVSATRKISSSESDELDIRAVELVGEGYLTAYPPVKSAIRMLILHNDMYPAYLEEENPFYHTEHFVVENSRFEIVHQTVAAVKTASNRILQSGTLANPSTPKPANAKVAAQTPKNKTGDPRTECHHYLFATHNLYLLKQLILVYELQGVTKVSELDFSDVWRTLQGLRDRGQLLDPRAYYKLLREGKLMPKVLERIEDARVELDGVLRSSIVNFTQGWAGRIVEQLKKEGRTDIGGGDDPCTREFKWVLGWTLVGEEQLSEALVSAVLELCKKGIEDDSLLQLGYSSEKMRL